MSASDYAKIMTGGNWNMIVYLFYLENGSNQGLKYHRLWYNC